MNLGSVNLAFELKRQAIVLVLFGILECSPAEAWPSYRGGNERRSFSAGVFPRNASLAWNFQSTSVPSPAWPAPARRSYWQNLESIAARVVDDHGFQPVVANSRVYFGSSSDDHLYCLNLTDGQLAWRFATEGPIRYAPTVSGNHLVFGSDDGSLYCLDGRSGALIWKRRLGESDWRIPGQGRLISAWPIRTGCVVVGRHVYATAGLYPQQGAWTYCLDLLTGEIQWKVAMEDSPQGYLLASRDHLFVPTGRSQPVALELSTGRMVRRLQSLGGTFAVIDDTALLGGRGNDGSLAMTDTETGVRLSAFKGSQMAVGPRYTVMYVAPELVLMDRATFNQATRDIKRWRDRLAQLQRESKKLTEVERSSVERKRARAHAAEQLLAAEAALEQSRRGVGQYPGCHALLSTSTTAVLGHSRGVAAVDLESGDLVWESEVPGTVVGLAFSEGRLIASTASGGLYCYADAEGANDPIAEQNRASGFEFAEHEMPLTRVKEVLENVPVANGFAVLVGNRSVSLIRDLLEHSKLRIVVIHEGDGRTESLREWALERGLYGTRLSVHRITGERPPVTDHVAALVVHDGTMGDDDEWNRIARPHGGVIWDLAEDAINQKAGLDGEGTWTHLYGNLQNTASSGDGIVTSELALQWFGGVGPRRMVDRHLRGSAPLYSAGMMVVPGENVLIGVDAYTGEEQWELEIPRSQRYSMPYDAGYMSLREHTLAVAVENECWLVDTSVGKVLQRVPLPDMEGNFHWGYVGNLGERLIGTRQIASASRTRPSRGQIDSDYRNAQGIVCSEGLFATEPKSERVLWQRSSDLILNPTLTIGGEAIYYIGCGRREGERIGRLPLSDVALREPRLVSVDASSGRVKWEVPLPESLRRSRNIFYLAQAREFLMAVGSFLNDKNDTTYLVHCFSTVDGRSLWDASHEKGKPGETFHGEQLHHPVIIGDRLVTEPVLYDLATGRPLSAHDEAGRWALSRPGHSCGTLSSSGRCLFFRAGNPTVLDLDEHLAGRAVPTKLSPTRPGCWINIIPAGGLVLIPEASAGCVCDFSLQTSMAFRPR